MTQVTLDAATAQKLAAANGPLELCAPDGRILGDFAPRAPRTYPAAWAPAISEEELDRREMLPGGRTLAEIMADLERRA